MLELSVCDVLVLLDIEVANILQRKGRYVFRLRRANGKKICTLDILQDEGRPAVFSSSADLYVAQRDVLHVM